MVPAAFGKDFLMSPKATKTPVTPTPAAPSGVTTNDAPDGYATIASLFGVPAPATARVKLATPGEYTPPINPKYKFRKDLLRAILLWHHQIGGPNIMLVGPSGTGKSSLIEQFCARIKKEVFVVQCHGRMEPSHFCGQIVLAEGNSGSTITKWVDGPLVMAMKRGASVVLDEYDMLPPDTSAWLHRLRDERRVLVPETGELVIAQKEFNLAVTANTMGLGDDTGAYRGTKAQNMALLDGFTVARVGYMEADDECDVVLNSLDHPTPEMPQAIRVMRQVAEGVRKNFQEGSMDITITTRSMIRWAALSQGLLGLHGSKSIIEGARLAFLNRADVSDETTITNLIEAAISSV
jgi:cobaltochelatase CobS